MSGHRCMYSSRRMNAIDTPEQQDGHLYPTERLGLGARVEIDVHSHVGFLCRVGRRTGLICVFSRCWAHAARVMSGVRCKDGFPTWRLAA